MNESDRNINKDMIDSDLIDLESLDFSNDQTWLYKVPNDSGHNVDVIDWSLSCDWPNYTDEPYLKAEAQLASILDNICKNETTTDDKQKFDSRTYVRPKKRTPRPSIQTVTNSTNKYLTYNKYSSPLAGASPMMRLKTFNIDSDDAHRELVRRKTQRINAHDDAQPEEVDSTLISQACERLSSDNMSKPIKIDYSQPAHYLHNSFNKGLPILLSERPSLNMYESGESLMRMSPPSLVSSLMMDRSGNYNSLDRNGLSDNKNDNPTAGRESIDPMLTSMTLSILDDKDMSTSFLSQTTHPDNDNLIDSLPPSLVNSINSSFVASTHSKDTPLYNDHEKLLNRPKYQPFKRDSRTDSNNSYTNDTFNVLNENSPKASNILTDTVTLHYSNKLKGSDDEKENLNSTFEKKDDFYLDNGDIKGKGSMNVTLDKHELNEIKQARQKLSLARKNLPVDTAKTELQIQMPDQTVITVPRQVIANDLLSKRRDDIRDTPKRNDTFKKMSPKYNSSYNIACEQMIDINSATMNLIDSHEKHVQDDWNPESRAMVGSNESTDTATFSSSSPPDSVPDNNIHMQEPAESTPLRLYKVNGRPSLNQITKTISPIYTTVDTSGIGSKDRTYDPDQTVINTATMVKRPLNCRRDIIPKKESVEKKSPPHLRSPTHVIRPPTHSASDTTMAPPMAVPKRSGLPSSKLRQYSSHKDLSRIPPANPVVCKSNLPHRGVLRTPVYSSNPALSPTSQQPTHHVIRRDSYILSTDDTRDKEKSPPPRPQLVRQGTETIRRPSTKNNKELRGGGSVTMLANAKTKSMPVPSRPNSIAGMSALRGYVRPTGQLQKTSTGASSTALDNRATESRFSALPRPSRLPAPRKTQRPPSAYSVAPSGEYDHY